MESAGKAIVTRLKDRGGERKRKGGKSRETEKRKFPGHTLQIGEKHCENSVP